MYTTGFEGTLTTYVQHASTIRSIVCMYGVVARHIIVIRIYVCTPLLAACSWPSLRNLTRSRGPGGPDIWYICRIGKYCAVAWCVGLVGYLVGCVRSQVGSGLGLVTNDLGRNTMWTLGLECMSYCTEYSVQYLLSCTVLFNLYVCTEYRVQMCVICAALRIAFLPSLVDRRAGEGYDRKKCERTRPGKTVRACALSWVEFEMNRARRDELLRIRDCILLYAIPIHRTAQYVL